MLELSYGPANPALQSPEGGGGTLISQRLHHTHDGHSGPLMELLMHGGFTHYHPPTQ